MKTSIEKILHPEAVECSLLILAILAASILVKCYMAYYNKRLGKKLDSAVMSATAADSFSDMVSTFFVFLVTIASLFTDFNLDGWCGILVGLFIFYTGITAMKETVDPLLGQPPTKELVQQIMDIVNSHSSILGIHDLLVHDYGPGNLIISLHAEVSAKGDILKIHDEIDNIERELKQRLNCTATIHMDPVVTDDAFSNQMRDKVDELLRELDPELKMHDFRMVTGPSHTNLIFDVVVPYNCPLSPDARIYHAVFQRLRSHRFGSAPRFFQTAQHRACRISLGCVRGAGSPLCPERLQLYPLQGEDRLLSLPACKAHGVVWDSLAVRPAARTYPISDLQYPDHCSRGCK